MKKWLIFNTGVSIWVAMFLITGCASVQQPSGGAKDTTPPKVIKEKPKNLNTRFAGTGIEVEFDEFVKLNNEYTEVSISPALETPPQLRAQKEKVSIKLESKLEPNTTYTISFGKAIGDVNENNLLKNYRYVFSTGDVVDSLSISGNIRSGLSNEPLKEVTVFVFSVNQDSLFGKKKPSIYTQTDSAGNFSLNNLKEGEYRIYALKEASTDRIYEEGVDEIGFIDAPLVLNKNIKDINLRIFKEEPTKFKVKERKIEADGSISMVFNKGIIKPDVKESGGTKVLNGGIKEFSPDGDSLKIWLPEMNFDSLAFDIYSDEALLEKVKIDRNKRETYNRMSIIGDNLPNGKLKPGKIFQIVSSWPISAIDTNKISLLADSAELSGWNLKGVPESKRKFEVNYPFRTGKLYTLILEEGAFTTIAGTKNKAYRKDLMPDDPENYGNLSLTVIPPDTLSQYVVQLLGDKERIISEEPVRNKRVINYSNYATGKYTIRVVLDENRNGKWDSGSLEKKRQPEKTWNYEKAITLRANWDLEESITLPRDW